jgi:dethiobiotin synthetase
MAKRIFVAATGQNSGKTTTSLSLLHLARKKYDRIGFIKPIGPKLATLDGRLVDKDAALMAQVYGLEKYLEYMSPVVLQPGTTKKVLEGEISPADFEEKVLQAVAVLDRECDFLIVEGAGHSGVGTVLGMSNAQIARMVDAPVLMVTGGGIGNVVDSVGMNAALFRQEGAEIRAIVANKIIPEKREETLHYLNLAFRGSGIKVIGGFTINRSSPIRPCAAFPAFWDFQSRETARRTCASSTTSRSAPPPPSGWSKYYRNQLCSW